MHKILKPNTQYTFSYNYELIDVHDRTFPDFNIRIGFVLWEKDDIQNRNRYLFATNFKTKNVKKYFSKLSRPHLKFQALTSSWYIPIDMMLKTEIMIWTQ